VTRWNRRLLLGAVAVLVPALAGCEAGFNAPTQTFHPANFGVDAAQNGVTIDNAFVLQSAPGSSQAGAFFALSAANGDRLDSVSAIGAASVQLPGGSVDLPAQALVNLGGPEPQAVITGLASPLTGGQTVTLTFSFAQAGQITLTVPVEPPTDAYATYSPPAAPTPVAAAPTPPAPGSATASPNPTATP